MLWISWRKRVFSSFDFIFCETDTLSANGISTRNLPAKDNSAVRRGPLVEMGSLVICTRISWPTESKSPIFVKFFLQFEFGEGKHMFAVG